MNNQLNFYMLLMIASLSSSSVFPESAVDSIDSFKVEDLIDANLIENLETHLRDVITPVLKTTQTSLECKYAIEDIIKEQVILPTPTTFESLTIKHKVIDEGRAVCDQKPFYNPQNITLPNDGIPFELPIEQCPVILDTCDRTWLSDNLPTFLTEWHGRSDMAYQVCNEGDHITALSNGASNILAITLVWGAYLAAKGTGYATYLKIKNWFQGKKAISWEQSFDLQNFTHSFETHPLVFAALFQNLAYLIEQSDVAGTTAIKEYLPTLLNNQIEYNSCIIEQYGGSLQVLQDSAMFTGLGVSLLAAYFIIQRLISKLKGSPRAVHSDVSDCNHDCGDTNTCKQDKNNCDEELQARKPGDRPRCICHEYPCAHSQPEQQTKSIPSEILEPITPEQAILINN